MGDWIENIGLRTEGFSDDQIAQIDAAKPDLLHIIADFQAIWPHIAPFISPLVPRITKLLPVARMVLEVLNKTKETS